ncbi:MAG: sulfurtransferase-like selenium metabolism protein YedF [Deltaproteobacteria bacterium]|nr:sulfurtransferase-like selenium metabolism protein YedF [Deltaproteobacteria bacterium]
MSQRITIDCRGLKCPQPVLRVKDALERMVAGEIEITVDNEASRSNIERFAKSQGCPALVSQEGENFRIIISKTGDSRPEPGAADASQFTCRPGQGEIVHVISAETMGRGSEELGKVLMRAYVKTIKDVTPLPRKILFYNSGVRITATESDLIAPLRELESKGVEIFSCGTCLDFFDLKEKLMVGKPTNMYEIMQSMSSAAHVVSPY